jgi:hypothetical protein
MFAVIFITSAIVGGFGELFPVCQIQHVKYKVVDCQSGDSSDWLVLAMRENAQLSEAAGIAAHVRSSLWAGQFQKLLHSLPDASSFVPAWGVASMHDDSVTSWPSIDADQAS